MRILFICSEYEGLIKTGGLADACKGLAQSLVAAGHQVTVALPRYAGLYQLPISDWQSVYFQLAGRQFGCAVRHARHEGVDIALIEHDDFFQRARPYDDGERGYTDNPLRFSFFCKATLEWALQTEQSFDIIHGHDWQSAASAYYLKHHYGNSHLANAAFVFSIHNGAYQEKCAAHWRGELDIAPQRYDELNFLATAIECADKLNTVSCGYRDELMHEPAGEGLSALYQQRKADFIGILNGCDYNIWHPQYDQHLAEPFDVGDMQGKQACKIAILKHFHLAPTSQPLFVGVSRLTGQKGYDYLVPALRQWLASAEAQVVIMGTGEAKYCLALETLQWDFPHKFRFIQGFSDALAHQLEAAGDFFLMPSLFEPCGLNQLYSLRYGTVPLVRLTGGLKDTVKPWPARGATGIGFVEPDVNATLAALQQAQLLYSKTDSYARVQKNGMVQNFSWSQSGEHYLALYQQAIEAKAG
ncbi:glycogen/starch synthase [Rheinheimera baltica]|uniref:glycogen synthase n=1 Tax=Rheinheimera baltica TaxID=67576 RepID=UPI00273D870F|nr:glycogen/starch synthase [Rheinheimera baltica]MDP5143389.1 glycogen/starch synthase [Rheinheimera baltica]